MVQVWKAEKNLLYLENGRIKKKSAVFFEIQWKKHFFLSFSRKTADASDGQDVICTFQDYINRVSTHESNTFIMNYYEIKRMQANFNKTRMH